MDTAVIIALISLVGSLLVAGVSLLTIREQRRKLDAEAEALRKQAETAAQQVDVDRHDKLIDQLQEDNDRLRRQMAEKDGAFACLQREMIAMRSEIGELRAGVTILITQIRELGEEPNWEPRRVAGGND